MDAVAQLNSILSDRYRVEREIGKGGMATVYLARDFRHDRLVALKVLDAELGAVLGVERFLAEIKVTANLQHPNLLPLFDSGEAAAADARAPGLLFYVMPFVEGESLRARLEREKQLPVDEALRLAVAIASALDYAHRHGVIHRDLKPENILLHEGQPLLADFGIALAVSNAGGNRITQTGLSLGTPQYMSPEQATGDRVIDRRSDIYSLAAVTYEMLTGEPPHTASTSQAVIARLLTEQPRSVRVTRPSVPPHVERAVARALAKLPADRWSTAGEFAAALEGRVAAAADDTAPVGMRGWRARRRDPVLFGLAGVALVATVAAVREGAQLGRGDREVIRFALTMPAGLRLQNGTTGANAMALSPDGRLIAFIGADRDGVSRIYLRSLDDATPRSLPGTESSQQPFFSPDGKWLAFWASGKLEKVAVSGGAPIVLADMPVATGGTWSSSGVIVTTVNNQLVVVPDVGGTPRRLTHASGAPGGSAMHQELNPRALSDGRHVLFTAGSGAGMESDHIWVADLKTGDATQTDIGGNDPVGIVDGTLIFGLVGSGLLAVPIDTRRWRAAGGVVSVDPDVVVNANGVMRAALSASGTLVYQAGSREMQVVAVDMHGNSHPLLAASGAYSFPRLSPDGRRLALSVASGRNSDVWIYDLPSGTPTRLTSGNAVNDRPEWTPDGKRVLFRTSRTGRSSLWWVPVDQSGPETPLQQSDRLSYFEGVFTPDGRTLVYQMDTLTSDLYFRSLTGDTTSRPITATPSFSEDRARVSPDGHLLAYVTTESGGSQVAVAPFPGPGPHILASSVGGTSPVWAPDGRHLYYMQGEHLMSAAIVESTTPMVSSTTMLFEGNYAPSIAPHANYDATHDGRGFIMLKPTGDPELMVVHNWTTELRRRLAGNLER